MLKLLEAIFAGKCATENIDNTGHPQMRGQLQCNGACTGQAAAHMPQPVQLPLHCSWPRRRGWPVLSIFSVAHLPAKIASNSFNILPPP